jgi:hypothetical protein
MNGSYSAEYFQAFAIDVWDGGENQVRIFETNAGISYPILMFGGLNGILVDYNTSYDYFFVIDGDGVIRWRGNFDDQAMRQAIVTGIEAIEARPVETSTWGGVKALYR